MLYLLSQKSDYSGSCHYFCKLGVISKYSFTARYDTDFEKGMLIFKHFIYKYFVISNHGGGEFMNSKDYQSPEIFLKLQQFKQLKVITYHRAILITEM